MTVAGTRRRTTRLAAAAAVSAGAVAVAATAAWGTPPTGVTPDNLARATLTDRVHITTHPRAQTDVLVQRLTFEVGGSTGWHTHPDAVVVTIAQGQMTFYETDCTSRVYRAGQAFVDPGHGHVHNARSTGTEPLVLYATYFAPKGAPVRQDVSPAPATCF